MTSAFDELLDLARRLGIDVRHAHLGGEAGALVRMRDRRVLFVDLDADPPDQLQRTCAALALLPELRTVFVRPDVRELLEAHVPEP